MDVTHLSSSSGAPDPTRLPDWRCRTAQKLFETGRPALPSRHDVPTRQLLDYLRYRQRCRGELDLQRLAMSVPYLHGAVLLRERANPSLLDIIEARIIARQSADQIGQLTGMPAGTIAAYEALCYDVRDRLDNTDYVHQQLVLGDARRLLTADENGATLKLLASLGGARALDQALPARDFSRSGTSSGFVAAIDTSTSIWLEAKAHFAVLTAGGSTARVTNSSMSAFAQRRHQERPQEDTTSGYEIAMQRFFQAVPFRVGPPDPATRCAELRKYDEAGVELNWKDELIIELGGKLVNEEMLLAFSARYRKQAE